MFFVENLSHFFQFIQWILSFCQKKNNPNVSIERILILLSFLVIFHCHIKSHHQIEIFFQKFQFFLTSSQNANEEKHTHLKWHSSFFHHFFAFFIYEIPISIDFLFALFCCCCWFHTFPTLNIIFPFSSFIHSMIESE